MRILIVEDDLEIAQDLVKGLSENNFLCTHASDGHQGLKLALVNKFDLIITDLMLPFLDGMEMILQLKKNKIQTPVLILTAKRSLDDRVLGLENGGDDYLVKPYAFVELLARVKNLIRLSQKSTHHIEPTEMIFLDLSLNLLTRELSSGEKKIALQTKEFQLLEFFMKNPQIPLSKNQILEKIWGYSFDPQTNVVDVLVYRLRTKISKELNKSYIQTIKGIGYVLKAES